MSTAKAKKETISKKDKRSYLKRLAVAASVFSFAAFSFIVFSAFELFAGNRLDFNFPAELFWSLMLPIALLVIIVCSALFSLLRGRLFDIVISVIFGLSVCGYIQQAFFNGSMKVMTGENIDMSGHILQYCFELVGWLAFIAIPVLLVFLKKKLWKSILIFVSLSLIVVQGSGTVFLALTTNFSTAANTTAYLTDKGMFELSKKDNVVVFILDYYDSDYIDKALQTHPDYLDSLGGFTYFSNTTSIQARTYPALPHFFVEDICHYDLTTREYINSSTRFLSDIKSLDYNIGVYTNTAYVGDANSNLCDNASKAQVEYSQRGIIVSLAKSVIYRISPSLFKGFFWFDTAEVARSISVDRPAASDGARWASLENSEFCSELNRVGLSVTDSNNGCFRFYHLNGTHEPYTIDENAVACENSTLEKSIIGSIKMVSYYLEDMKALGVFDDATIIITADHGKAAYGDMLTESPTPIFFMKPSGVSDKEALKTSSAPISNGDLQATVIAAIGLDESKYDGMNVLDVKEDAERTRYFYFAAINDDIKETYALEYEIKGNSRDFSNWSFTGNKWKIYYSYNPVQK